MRKMAAAVILLAAPTVLAQEQPIGTRVRVQTADVVEMPGLGRIDRETYRMNGRVTEASTTLTVARDGAEMVTLPRTRTSLIGEVVASDPDMLTIRLDGRDVSVLLPRASVARLEVSRGRRSNSALKGAVVGLALGAAGGALLGYATRPDESWFTSSETAQMGGVLLGTIGCLVGAVVGAQHAERWETVFEPPRKPAVSLRPLGTRGLSLALRF